MQAADTPRVEEDIQRALANESATELRIKSDYYNLYNDGLGFRDSAPLPPLTDIDSQCIIACLRRTPRVNTLSIFYYSLHDDAVLNVFCDGLPLCTSITTVKLQYTRLTNEDLDHLRPAFYNTSVTKLYIIGRLYDRETIEGQRGGEVFRNLLVGNDTLRELHIDYNPIGPEVAIGFGQGLTDNHGLQILHLDHCQIGNDFLANLLPANGMNNNSLLHLDLSGNNIEGADGGRQVSLLLPRFPALQVLRLGCNHRLGPLGARALAPGLAAAASHLESLDLHSCRLGNDGVANLVPDGQVNMSLTNLNIRDNNIQGLVGGENVITLAARCTNLDSIGGNQQLSSNQQHRLDLLLGPKQSQRLCTEAAALAGSSFSVLFRFVEVAHRHKHGLSAIFLIIQNDGDDYFCNANNRTIE